MSQVQENTSSVENTEIVQNNVEELEIVDSPESGDGDLPEANPAKSFDPKTDRVEFTTPEQQAKFDYMYKQTKMSDARNAMYMELMQKQQQKLEDLENRFKNTDSADAENILLSKIKTARDSGDDAAEIAALNELVDFKADKKINSFRPQQQTQPQAQNQDTQYINSLISETDDYGTPLRPWLQEGNPEFDNAIRLLETSISPKFKGDPLYIQKSLYELDQIMRNKMTEQKTPSQPQTRTPNPMQGSNLTNVSKKPTIKMTRQEIDIAKKLGVDPKKYAARRDAEIAKGRK